MSWESDLLSLAQWAFQIQDMRHRYLYAETAESVAITPGIAWCLETVAVLAIYEAAIGKGYKRDKTIGYEKPYPGSDGKNPKRSDLAFKSPGRGKNWAFVEVKRYQQFGKNNIECDLEKLKGITTKCQRWILTYKIYSKEGRFQTLESLLKKNFSFDLEVYGTTKFETVTEEFREGYCEICLVKVKTT